MSIQIIPDKVCPHCGGTTWLISNTGQVICSRLHNERSRLYRLNNLEKCRKQQREYIRKTVMELSDVYVRNMLIDLGFTNSQIDSSTIEKYRSYAKIRRNVKHLKRAIMEKQKQVVEELKRKYEELGNSLNSLPHKERNAIYQKRSHIKKKLMSIGEYENLAVLGTESKQSLDEIKAELESLQPDFDKPYEERKKVYDRRKELKETIKAIEPEYESSRPTVARKEQKDEMTYAQVIEKVSTLGTQIQELYTRISGLISEHNKYVELLKFETL